MSFTEYYTKSSLILFICAMLCTACSGRLNLNAQQVEQDRKIRNAEKLYQSLFWIDRRNAVITASEYKSKRSMTLLIRASGDTHNRVKIEAIRSLGSYDTPASFQILTENTKSDDVIVKYYSLSSLSSFKSPKTVPFFIEGLDHPDWMIREISITGLLEINDAHTKKILPEYILKALNDENENVRIAAMTNCKIRDNRIGKKLEEEILKDKTGKKFTYLSALLKAVNGYPLNDKTKEVLMGLLTHQNLELRILALRALKSSQETERRNNY